MVVLKNEAIVLPSLRSLAGQFLMFQLLVVVVVLFAVAAVSVAQSTREFREVRGQRMIAVAENMASTPIVRDRCRDRSRRGCWRRRWIARSSCRVRGWPRFWSRTGPCACRRIRRASGRRMDLGASRADRAGHGSATWTSTGRTPRRTRPDSVRHRGRARGRVGQRRLPVGLGAAQRRRGAAAVVPRNRRGLGLLGSWLLSRRIKTHTRGLEIAEIAGLADHREALLHSIREGVVAVNTDGRDHRCSTTAPKNCSTSAGDAVGRQVDDVALDPAVGNTSSTGRTAATWSCRRRRACSR